ncbi:hypothetical protein Droror1_Dr00007959 [Drosera rotundifolia]
MVMCGYRGCVEREIRATDKPRGNSRTMAATATSSSQNPAAASDAGYNPLQTQMRLHEVAIAELKSLSASRTVYQRNGNIFFRTTVEKATTTEQRQLDTAVARIQKPKPT